MNRYKQKNFFSFFEKYPKHYYVFGAFVLAFLIICSKLFSYTVINHKFYQKLADKQQIGSVKIPVTRGTIYSSTNSGTVLATSVILNDLAIDPKLEGSKERLIIFLRDIVFKEICNLKSKNDCYDSLLNFLGVLELKDFSFSDLYIKTKIIDYLKVKLAKQKVTSVLLESELTLEIISEISSLNLPGIYLNNGSLYANPEEISDEENTINSLYKIIGWDKDDIRNYIKKRDIRYITILNKISLGTSEEIKNYIEEEKDSIKKGILDKKNSISNFIILSPNPSRLYPERNIGSQIIGFTDSSGIGRYGIEGHFDNILKGSDGNIKSRKDINGRVIDMFDNVNDNNFKDGATIYLTIDRNIQAEAERLVEDGVKKYLANKGTIVVMDPKTGAIKAMASYPNFDSNNPGDVYSLEKVTYSKYPNPKVDLLGKILLVEDSEKGEEFYYDGKKVFLREATSDERDNFALIKYKYKNDLGALAYQDDSISSLYEPGSIMKAITVAIGIDTGEITSNSMYNDEGDVHIGKYVIKNVSNKCLGYNSFAHALNYSCNVGMIRIAQKYGSAIAYEYLNNFGFGDKTGISLKGEVSSKIEIPEKWSRAKLFTTSFGLGISVTPLQMAVAYSVLANGGIYIKPSIIDRIEFSDGNVINYKPELVRRVIKESTSKTLTTMLVDSVKNGVAQNGGVKGYNIAGKTGTSQIATKGKYETGIGATITSFAGYGPAEDPKFVVIVKLERSRISEYGSTTSAYMFRDMMAYLLDYYGIPKREDIK